MDTNSEFLNLVEDIQDINTELDKKASKASVDASLNSITTNNLIVGTVGNIVEALDLVSHTVHGRMSKEDKIKLDGIEEGSNKYIHPNTHPSSMITEDDAKRFVSQAMVDGWNADIANRYTKAEIDNMISGLLQNIDWKESVNTFADLATTYPNPEDGWTVNVKDTDITYRWNGTTWIAISLNALPLATQSVDGKMSKEDKKKLDGIAVNANNYVHPSTHPATMITQDATHRFVSDTEKTTWNNKANASHGNHVPTTETANNARFLRNDNTWQAVTPGNIGAYTKAEVDSKVLNGVGQQRIGGYYSGSGGKQPPSFVESGKIKFLMSNEAVGSDSGYKDWIYMDTYSGSDVPVVTAFGISKSSSLRAFLMQGAKAGSTWDRKAEIWHSGNFDPNSKASLSGCNFTGDVEITTDNTFGWSRNNDYFRMGFSNTSDADTDSFGYFEMGDNSNEYFKWRFRTSGSTNTADAMTLRPGGTLNVVGNITGAKVYNAVWNDYAELFPKLKSTITEAGDIIALDIINDKEVYTKATEELTSFIVGVHSDEFGILLGGNRVPLESKEQDLYEYNKSEYIPVGLAGRVRAKCIGVIKKGDKLVISDIPGVARAYNPKLDNINNVFGMAVENKTDGDRISRVKMFIKN